MLLKCIDKLFEQPAQIESAYQMAWHRRTFAVRSHFCHRSDIFLQFHNAFPCFSLSHNLCTRKFLQRFFASHSLFARVRLVRQWIAVCLSSILASNLESFFLQFWPRASGLKWLPSSSLFLNYRPHFFNLKINFFFCFKCTSGIPVSKKSLAIYREQVLQWHCYPIVTIVR